MAKDQSLTVQEKQELQSRDEQTVPGRFYVPSTDIYEHEEELVVVVEVPGVAREDVAINVENDQLSISARLNFDKYANYQPVYTEYNLGNFTRSFHLSNKIDSSAIDAKMKDGVLTLRLPKIPEAKPRKIKVN